MLISKKGNGDLCFSCEECSWTCDRPEDLDEFDRGYEGFEMKFEVPTMEEIRAKGWEQYCVYTLEELKGLAQIGPATYEELDASERAICDALRTGAMDYDEIRLKTGLDEGSLNDILLILQHKEMIVASRGDRYRLKES